MLDQVSSAPPPELERPAIVVVAPANTGNALIDCLARKCPVIDDVNATMRHAEALFAAGEYLDARAILLQSLARNRAAVDTNPRAVAALYEAGATVAEHNGDKEEYCSFALKSAYIIAKAPILSPTERLMGYIRAGDVYAALGDRPSAMRNYRFAQNIAESGGLNEIGRATELRRLWISATPGQSGPQRARLAAIIAAPDTDPKLALFARTMLARLERQEGDTTATDRLLAAVQVQPVEAAPVLAWSPPVPELSEVEDEKQTRRYDGSSPLRQQGGTRLYRWADIGYWVRPDGRVADAEILRGSPDLKWTKPIVAMVSGRRYLTSRAAAHDPGKYRIERVTLTYEWRVPAGSLIRRRIGEPSYRFADLTRDPAPPGTSGG